MFCHVWSILKCYNKKSICLLLSKSRVRPRAAPQYRPLTMEAPSANGRPMAHRGADAMKGCAMCDALRRREGPPMVWGGARWGGTVDATAPDGSADPWGGRGDGRTGAGAPSFGRGGTWLDRPNAGMTAAALSRKGADGRGMSESRGWEVGFARVATVGEGGGYTLKGLIPNGPLAPPPHCGRPKQ